MLCYKLHNINMLSAANCKLAEGFRRAGCSNRNEYLSTATHSAHSSACRAGTGSANLQMCCERRQLECCMWRCLCDRSCWQATEGCGMQISWSVRYCILGCVPIQFADCRIPDTATAHTHSSSQQPAGADYHSRNSGPDSTATFTKINSAAAAA
jgi:hypothetical protein